MRRIVDEEKKIVYFEGDWPTVMGIPHIMKKYPGYTHCVLNYENFQQLKYEQTESL